MAEEVIKEIRAAEEKAKEIRRAAAVAARDAVKMARQEYDEISEKEISTEKSKAKAEAEKSEEKIRDTLKAENEKRLKEIDELKKRTEKNLSSAADKCLERIIG